MSPCFANRNNGCSWKGQEISWIIERFLCQCTLELAQFVEVKSFQHLFSAIYSANDDTIYYKGDNTSTLIRRSAFLHDGPRSVITPSSSSDTRFCAFDPQSTDTAGTALRTNSDHSFEDFE